MLTRFGFKNKRRCNNDSKDASLNGDLTTIRTALQKLQAEVKARFKAEIIGIFGSYARGEATKRSDLDIIVRFQEGASLFELVGLANFLESRLGIKVDVVPETAIRPELREHIFRELVRI